MQQKQEVITCFKENDFKNHKIIVIHGLWHSRFFVSYLVYQLYKLGFTDVQSFGYNSIFNTYDIAVNTLAQKLTNNKTQVSLVGHSLGGLIALETARTNSELAIKNVICLGTPILGSQIAKKIAQNNLSKWILGGSCDLLLRGCIDLPQKIAVGMIAGNKMGFGAGAIIGNFSDSLDEESDGVVNLTETYTKGLTDYLVLDTDHTGLLFDTRVAKQISNFLNTQSFLSN